MLRKILLAAAAASFALPAYALDNDRSATIAKPWKEPLARHASLNPHCRPWPPFGLLCTAGFNRFSWRAVPLYLIPLGYEPEESAGDGASAPAEPELVLAGIALNGID